MPKGERPRRPSVNETARSVRHSFPALKVSGERCGLRIPPRRGVPGRTQPLGSPRGSATLWRPRPVSRACSRRTGAVLGSARALRSSRTKGNNACTGAGPGSARSMRRSPGGPQEGGPKMRCIPSALMVMFPSLALAQSPPSTVAAEDPVLRGRDEGAAPRFVSSR
jgi:hypothetical protein